MVKRLKDKGFVGEVFGHQNNAFMAWGSVGIASGGRLVKVDPGFFDNHRSGPGQILLFPNPHEMTTDQIPTMIALTASGEKIKLNSP